VNATKNDKLQINVGASYLCRDGLTVVRIIFKSGVAGSKSESFWCTKNNEYAVDGRLKKFSDGSHPMDIISIAD
jgi:hypothetical protein